MTRRLRLYLAALCSALGLLLPACASAPPPTHLVPCRVTQVTAPDFPFDRLPLGADIHTQTKTLLADRQERQGYEGQLVAANRGCP